IGTEEDRDVLADKHSPSSAEHRVADAVCRESLSLGLIGPYIGHGDLDAQVGCDRETDDAGRCIQTLTEGELTVPVRELIVPDDGGGVCAEGRGGLREALSFFSEPGALLGRSALHQ